MPMRREIVEKGLEAYGLDAEYEQLILGIFQGAPGITGSVWCRVPLDRPSMEVAVRHAWLPEAKE